jgi:hypothetical protein
VLDAAQVRQLLSFAHEAAKSPTRSEHRRKVGADESARTGEEADGLHGDNLGRGASAVDDTACGGFCPCRRGFRIVRN